MKLVLLIVAIKVLLLQAPLTNIFFNKIIN